MIIYNILYTSMYVLIYIYICVYNVRISGPYVCCCCRCACLSCGSQLVVVGTNPSTVRILNRCRIDAQCSLVAEDEWKLLLLAFIVDCDQFCISFGQRFRQQLFVLFHRWRTDPQLEYSNANSANLTQAAATWFSNWMMRMVRNSHPIRQLVKPPCSHIF